MNEKICIFTLRALLREIMYIMYHQRGLNNEHKLLRDMEKEIEQCERFYPDQEFVRDLQEDLVREVNKILEEATERAKRIASGEVYPEPVVYQKDDIRKRYDDVKKELEEAIKNDKRIASEAIHRDPVVYKPGKELAVNAAKGECKPDIQRCNEVDIEQIVDSELKNGELAAEKLGKTIEKSKDLIDDVNAQFGEREPVTAACHASNSDGFVSQLEEEKKKRDNTKRDKIDTAKDEIAKIRGLKEKGEWVKPSDFNEEKAGESFKVKLPDGQDATVEVSPAVKQLLTEPVEDLVAKQTESSDISDEDIAELLKIFRKLRGDDQWDNPVSKLKAGLAQIMRGESHEDEFISDDTLDPVRPAGDPEKEKRTDEQLWKEKKFRGYTDEMFKIFQAKNQDYTAAENIGSSFDLTYDLFGPIAPAVRFMDKVLRYVSLASGKEQKVNDESVKDTLTDLANYALLTRLKIEKDEKQKA